MSEVEPGDPEEGEDVAGPTPLQALQTLIGVEFTQPDWLSEALMHESYTHEHGLTCSNERLEFLGDAVVGLVIADHLFVTWPERREGDLTRMKSQAVSTEFLAERARDLGLGTFLILGKGEDASGGRHRQSVLADALEALIGAVFLDQGLAVAQRFVLHLFDSHLPLLGEAGKDYKGELQERTQKLFRGLPRYSVVHEEGPPHSKSFSVRVAFGTLHLGSGVGSSKKQAEQAAAQEALERFDSLMLEEVPGHDPDAADDTVR